MHFTLRPDLTHAAQACGWLALAGGVLFWAVNGASPQLEAGALTTLEAPVEQAPLAAARWFAAPSGDLDARLLGILSGARPVVVLSLDGKAPQAFREGERLPGGARIKQIRGDTLVIERHGREQTVVVPALAAPPALAELKAR